MFQKNGFFFGSSGMLGIITNRSIISFHETIVEREGFGIFFLRSDRRIELVRQGLNV